MIHSYVPFLPPLRRDRSLFSTNDRGAVPSPLLLILRRIRRHLSLMLLSPPLLRFWSSYPVEGRPLSLLRWTIWKDSSFQPPRLRKLLTFSSKSSKSFIYVHTLCLVKSYYRSITPSSLDGNLRQEPTHIDLRSVIVFIVLLISIFWFFYVSEKKKRYYFLRIISMMESFYLFPTGSLCKIYLVKVIINWLLHLFYSFELRCIYFKT